MIAIKNVEAEVSVLGSVLVDGTLFTDLVIQEEHFYQADHQLIFRAMKAVVDAEQFIDMVTVTTELGEAINQVGGTSYLLAMAQSIASTEPLKHHEQLIFSAYRSRKAREYALRFAEEPADQALGKLIKDLQACRETGAEDIEKTVDGHLLDITKEMCFPTQEQSGFLTSFSGLNEMTGGLQRVELIIVVCW